jgi:hypothetical protein
MPILTHNLPSIPLPRLPTLGPSNILLIFIISLLPLLDLRIRKARSLQPIRTLLLPALPIAKRLESVAPIVFCIRGLTNICRRVVGGGEARVHAHGVGFVSAAAAGADGGLGVRGEGADDGFEGVGFGWGGWGTTAGLL